MTTTSTDGTLGQRAPVAGSALGRLARRTFDALSADEARSVLQVRPDPVATVHRSGGNPVRILCFGGGPLHGIGLRDHEDGLPGRVADRVAELTQRGVQMDVVVEAEPTTPKALAGLAGLRLRRYDAVLVFVGDDGAGAKVDTDQWRGAFVGLTRLLLQESCTASGLFVYESGRASVDPAIPNRALRSSGAHAGRLVEVTEQVCSLTDRIRFADLREVLPTRDGSGRFSDVTYTDWGDLIATRLQPALDALSQAPDEQTPRSYRNRPQDERFRQRALDALRLRSTTRDERLDREMESARSTYRASGAAFTVIDGPLQWSKASTRPQPRVIPREAGICHFAIESDELTLINDTWLDQRTRSAPLTRGPEGIRFYAGYPVHSPDGYRVGMVCIYGTTPRSLRPKELEGLRDTAARVEQHLWNDILKGHQA